LVESSERHKDISISGYKRSLTDGRNAFESIANPWLLKLIDSHGICLNANSLLGKNFDTRTWENIRVNSSGVEYSTVSTLLFEL
jgi:hypothetical protein